MPTAAPPEAPAPAGPPPAAPAPAKASAPNGPPDQPVKYATTSGSIHWRNFDHRQAAYEKRLKERSDDPESLRLLAQHLTGRALVTGVLDELARARELLDRAVAAAPRDVAALTARARVLQGLHLFPAALADLDAAERVGPGDPDLRSARSRILWATGRYDEAKALMSLPGRAAGPFERVAAADVLYDLGRVGEARRAYRAALDGYTDVNPVFVAWVEVLQGETFLAAGDLPAALRLFEDAVRRLPGYTLAETHLAQALARSGDLARAEALYRGVAERTGDPLSAARLAGALRKAGKAAEAAAADARADVLLEARLARFPEATWKEAAELLLDLRGDAAKALPFAERNAGLRHDAASLVLLARAQGALGRTDDALVSVRKALATPVRREFFQEAAFEIFAKAGLKEEAAAAFERARELRAAQ